MIRALTILALAATSTTAFASTRTVSGIDIDANWSTSGGTWTASGDVSIGAIDLDVDSITATSTSLSADIDGLDIELLDGCSLSVQGQGSLGLSVGDDIIDIVPDAPVMADETYLYLDASGDISVNCHGLYVPLDDTSTRIYINPDDPSIYFHASEMQGQMGVSGPSLGAVTMGVSKQGLIPWVSPWNDVDGDPRYVDAHLVVGGDFEFTAGQYRIGVEQGEQAIRLDNWGRPIEVCASGRLYMPGLQLSDRVTVDLPLGQGVLCWQNDVLELSALLGPNEWSDYGLDPFLTAMLDEFVAVSDVSNRLEVEGSIRTDRPSGRLTFGNDPAELGFTNGLSGVEGTLALQLDHRPSLRVEGAVDYSVGPFDFANASAIVELGGRGLGMTTISGEANIPGTGGKDLEVDIRMDAMGGFSGSGDANLWGAHLDGSVRGFRTMLYSSTLSTGYSLRPLGSGKIKLELSNNDVDVKARACSLGTCKSVSVSTSGCFKIFGIRFCI